MNLYTGLMVISLCLSQLTLANNSRKESMLKRIDANITALQKKRDCIANAPENDESAYKECHRQFKKERKILKAQAIEKRIQKLEQKKNQGTPPTID